MKIHTKCLLMIILLMMSSFPSYQASAKLVDGVNSPKYAVRAPARFLQGVVNFSFGWSALILDPVRAAKSDKKVMDGVFEGMGNMITYTWLGAWDVGTCWVPAQMGKDMAGVKHNVFDL